MSIGSCTDFRHRARESMYMAHSTSPRLAVYLAHVHARRSRSTTISLRPLAQRRTRAMGTTLPAASRQHTATRRHCAQLVRGGGAGGGVELRSMHPQANRTLQPSMLHSSSTSPASGHAEVSGTPLCAKPACPLNYLDGQELQEAASWVVLAGEPRSSGVSCWRYETGSPRCIARSVRSLRR